MTRLTPITLQNYRLIHRDFSSSDQISELFVITIPCALKDWLKSLLKSNEPCLTSEHFKVYFSLIWCWAFYENPGFQIKVDDLPSATAEWRMIVKTRDDIDKRVDAIVLCVSHNIGKSLINTLLCHMCAVEPGNNVPTLKWWWHYDGHRDRSTAPLRPTVAVLCQCHGGLMARPELCQPGTLSSYQQKGEISSAIIKHSSCLILIFSSD